MTIRLLSTSEINRIAAGEVIERPSSVVKELVENSIDAFASRIEIKIENSGRNLISVLDNGSGIDLQDVDLVFTKHATSKLKEENLIDIESFGFRGEAVPSIASVSRFLLQTKTKSSEYGYEITVEGGVKSKDILPCVTDIGTFIEVRDLFYTTPNRVRFLKSENVETRAIILLLNSIAIANPNISFSLNVQGKNVFDYQSVDELIDRLKQIKEFGEEFVENSLYVSNVISNSNVVVSGYISIPTFNTSITQKIIFIVNNRILSNTFLLRLIKAAYMGLIPANRYPYVVINVTIPYEDIDVNVHPTKAEIRFKNENYIRSTVIGVIKDALSNSKLNVSATHLGNVGINMFHKECDVKSHQNDHTVSSLMESNDLGNVKKTVSKLTDVDNDHFISGNNYNVPINNKNNIDSVHKEVLKEDTKKEHKMEFMEDTPELGYAKCQLYNNYIISQLEDSFIIIDQHAAHERILYEAMVRNREVSAEARQLMLLDELVELDNVEQIEMLKKFKVQLLDLGIMLEFMGDIGVMVREVPVILGKCNVSDLIIDIVNDLFEINEIISVQEKIHYIIATISCHAAIRSGHTLGVDEMNELLRQMEQTKNTAQCNHGRPTHVKLKHSDLEKLFERT